MNTPTHLVIDNNLKEVGGVVHTHSEWATSWAQCGRGIPAMVTMNADYFYGKIPCTRKMTEDEINGKYELETGNIIVDRFRGVDPMAVPGDLVCSDGPFTWGKDAHDAVHNSTVMDEVAKMTFRAMTLNPYMPPLQ